MTLYRLLQEASFNEADIRQLSAAYEAALTLLKLRDRWDPVTELLAAKIIQVFRTGEHDPARLCSRTIKELGVPLPE